MGEPNRGAAGLPAAGRTASGPAPRVLHDVNLEGLLLLRGHLLAGGPAVAGWAGLLPLWQSLGEVALSRLADAPHLLFDAGFADPDVWRAELLAGVNDAGACRARGVGVGFGGPGRGEALAATERGRQYAATLILLAWQLAQGAPATAVVVAGLSPEISALLQGQGVHRVAPLAARAAPLLRPRWSRSPEFWQALLLAAASDDAQALRELRVLAQKRMLGGALRANRRQFP